MKKNYSFALAGVLSIFLLTFGSCTNSECMKQAQGIVINELMASNRTGLQRDGGEPTDWIEIKNTSNDTVDLEGFQLAVTKKKLSKENKKDTVEETKTWVFPQVKIAGGECLLVFADKLKEGEEAKDLTANFKLPKDGGTLQFLAPNGQVMQEVKFGKLSADQSLALQADSTYQTTYWQSPGFENSLKGFEEAMVKIDGQRKGSLRIWELMSRSPKSGDNWVELKNVGDAPVDISEYSIAKKMGKKEESWQLPSRTLQPGELIVIQLAGKKRNPNNPLQAPFKIGNAETVVLTKGGKFVDGMNAKLTPYGASIGRAEGKKGLFFYATPTRGAENGSDGKTFIAPMPEFDRRPGVYAKDSVMSIRLKDKTQKVHYTLDGSEPTASSPILKDSLVIKKNSVVRTFAEGDSTTMRSNIATASYLLGVNHDIPVINIAVNNRDLYDYNTGIYVEGPGYTPEWPHKGANYWQRWTKKAHVEFYDGDKSFATDCGLKIFGGFSRAEPKKSFTLKFKGMYGNSKVDYDFFGNGNPFELEDLVLRSGAQDYNRCMLRDEFFTSLMKAESPTILTQIYRPVALYINGEYFGLYYMREKIDKEFVARYLNVPNDSINIIMSKGYNEEGSKDAYNSLIKYVQTHDMKVKENYEYMKNNVDLLGLIDYKLGEIFSGNTDVGNIRYVRSTSPESDKKWHFVFYDLDASWVGYKPTAEYYLAATGNPWEGNNTPHNFVINRLLANNEFRQLFLERLSHHLSTTFSTKNTNAVFDKLVAQIRNEMKLNCERWPQLSYAQWEKNIEDFRAKFADKPQKMLDDLRQYLNITDAENKKYFGNLGY